MTDSDIRDDWSAAFVRTLTDELHRGVRLGVLTRGEAEQLGARVAVLVDQALAPLPVG